MAMIRTTRVYKRATGPRLKRAGYFYTDEVPRAEMDICPSCTGTNTQCWILEDLHEMECIIACDYLKRA